ncbi:hypothetical protein KV557_02770 [Kitasatospora aureofaciens]|uniref:DUF6185 family protein n=1 Tax=Kitasatospora aureofaciens TaxID=1894 RepID=UPI001C47EF74|nr:DUF6185 family protein [Kitasatospora aureofaciens]MBV6696048.1 hypothetical protein [Kitasatospora aureofaciens]
MTALAWRWIALAFAMLGWWGAQPTQAYAADTVNCPTQQLNKNTKLIFIKHYPDFVEIRQTTIIKVSEQPGGFTDDLMFGADTARYRNAMYCLLRGNSASQVMFDKWHPEWRSTSSQVTNDDHMVTVQYESWNLINGSGEFEVGPWLVEVRPGQAWEATLHSPDTPGALRGDASWESIEVNPGGLEISDASVASSTNEDGSRRWPSGSPDIKVKVVPPWALVPSGHAAWIVSLGLVSWWICASAVIAVSVWRFKKTVKSPDGGDTSALAKTALEWAALSAALGLTLLLLLHPSAAANRWRALIGISSGLILVLLAHPWLPLAHGSDDRGRRKAVLNATLTAATIGLLVILVPDLFNLSPQLMPEASPPATGIIGLALLDLSMVWLWLAAIVAWAWCFVREGELGEFLGGGESEHSESLGGGKPEHRLRPMAAIGAALFVAAVVVVACRWLSFHLAWERANWAGKASMRFGTDYRRALSQQLAEFASRGPQWVYSYTWVLAGMALVALLHLSFTKQETLELRRPEKVDLLLVTAIFAIVVALRGVMFAGHSAAVYGLWLPLNMVALYATVKVGCRWSVLYRANRRAEEDCVVKELSGPKGYGGLMEKARSCHDQLHRLHLLDRGHGEETSRDQLEQELRKLHHWLSEGRSHDCLPDEVSVVDVALSLGPDQSCWGNARKAACWAAIFGILPSVVTTWYENVHDAEQWTFTLNSPTGIPDTVGVFLAQEISFAGAGLVLGALWRLLPGERGPMRAFSLFIAWLVPIGVVAGIAPGLVVGAELYRALLRALLMLMVLTVTSMWMDTDTFHLERHVWSNRLSLLVSIYQVHGLSGQIAYLTAQMVAVLTIWQQISGI